jgi:hypothetical protein
VISSRHIETAASPWVGAQGWPAYLASRPSARQGGPAPRGDHHRAGTTQGNTGKIDTWAATEPSNVREH